MTAASFAGIVRNDVPIIQYLNFARQPAFDCVTPVLMPDKEILASGILIAPRYVLTAGHSFKSEKDTVYCKFNQKIYAVNSIVIHDSFKRSEKNGTDLAILELAEPVTNIAPAVLNPLSDEKGKIAAIIGYGRLSIADILPTPKVSGLRAGGMNTIDSVGKLDENSEVCDLLFADFDKPGPDPYNTITSGSSKPLPLEFIVDGGDSGGGMFIKENKKWVLAGVVKGTSHLDTKKGYGYGRIGKFVRVSAYQEWILKHTSGTTGLRMPGRK